GRSADGQLITNRGRCGEMPLTAAIEVSAGQTDPRELQVKLRIANPADRTIAILNPDMGVPAPAMNWSFSKELYQTALLISFGYLSISVSDEAGNELAQQAIQTWATPVLRPKLELAAGDAFKIAVPIGNFYRLAPNHDYQVALTYGDKDLKVSAQTRVVV